MYPQSQENSPKLVNMAQPAVKRPWIRHHELGSHIHPHILKVYDSASNRHDRSQGPTTSATPAQASIFSALTQVPQPFGKPPQPASLHRHYEPTPSSPVYSLPHLRPPPKTPPDPSLEASLFMYHDWVYPNRRLRFSRSTPVQHFHLSIRKLSISILL